MRHSRQREAIRRFVEGRCDHPTAHEVYLGVLPEFPQISLGTVYRNLMQLGEAGAVRIVDAGDGTARFDGRVSEHQHFRCTRCGRVEDVEIPAAFDLAQLLKPGLPGVATSYTLTVQGLCRDCQKQVEHEGHPLEPERNHHAE